MKDFCGEINKDNSLSRTEPESIERQVKCDRCRGEEKEPEDPRGQGAAGEAVGPQQCRHDEAETEARDLRSQQSHDRT